MPTLVGMTGVFETFVQFPGHQQGFEVVVDGDTGLSNADGSRRVDDSFLRGLPLPGIGSGSWICWNVLEGIVIDCPCWR